MICKGDWFLFSMCCIEGACFGLISVVPNIPHVEYGSLCLFSNFGYYVFAEFEGSTVGFVELFYRSNMVLWHYLLWAVEVSIHSKIIFKFLFFSPVTLFRKQLSSHNYKKDLLLSEHRFEFSFFFFVKTENC